MTNAGVTIGAVLVLLAVLVLCSVVLLTIFDLVAWGLSAIKQAWQRERGQ